ncbi:MAG TPA: hypothetical protein PLQ80_01910 [Candidatus Syntrophosphaera sp.]|mgnify:CR=1 FL=1|nr:hypothetical protein [Candidatus Syntrophosphaera sp.]
MRRIIVIALFFVFGAGLAGGTYRLQNLYSGSYDNPCHLSSNSLWVCITDIYSLNCWELRESSQMVSICEAALPENIWGVQSAVTVPGDPVNMPDIWLASNDGLLIYSGQKWKRYGEILPDYMKAGGNGEIWLIANGTLLKYDGKFKQMVSDMEWQAQAFGASCLQIDRKGFPWIGVMGPGIVRFNGTELDSGLGVPTGPPSDEPGQDDAAPQFICFDADNNPWVDYPMGVACWNNGTWVEHDLTQYGFEWGVSHLAADDQGIIWVSDGGQSVLCFDGDGWYKPEILGGNPPNDDWWIAQMIAGPDDSMLFLLASESPAYIEAYVCQPVEKLHAEPKQ